VSPPTPPSSPPASVPTLALRASLRRVRVSSFAKITVPLLVVVGLTVGISGYGFYRQNDDRHRLEAAEEMRRVAWLLSAAIDARAVGEIQIPTDFTKPAYQRTLALLRHASTDNEIAWIGVMREVEGRMSLVVDVGETGVGYPLFYATPAHFTALRQGTVEPVSYADEFGSYVGEVAPIRGADGEPIAIVEVSYHRDMLEMFSRHQRNQVFRAVGLAMAMAMFLSLVLTGVVVQRPLRRLRQGVAALSQGEFDHSLPVRGSDDFAQLADAFNRMAGDLKKMYGGLEGLVHARTESLSNSNADLQRALDQVKAAQELLLQSEKMAAVGELVSGVAHELNNPLAGVMGYSQLCLGKTQDPKLRGYLEKICHESERAARIVRNLLTFSRKTTTEPRLIDINEALRRTVELREYDLRVSDVAVEFDLSPEPLRTMADFHQIQQVFLNLLNNAAQAIRGHRARGRILCRTERMGNRLRITFADDGPGIAPENLHRIFDPFFTTKEVGQGTGLGLSICFGIVRQHNGIIRAGNRPEGGAEFIIELPVVLGERSGAEPPAAALPTPRPRSRILVVDDELNVREMLRDFLGSQGHDVDVAASSRGALELLRAQRYGVIISDIRMPDMAGPALWEQVHRLDERLAQRMVFSTGDAANPETLAFLDRVGNPHLHKPYRLEDLDHVIDVVLAQPT